MIIERNADALIIMTRFILDLINPHEVNRNLDFKLKTIAKDMGRGLLECAFEDIEALPVEIKAKIPARYFALFDARQAYCFAEMGDHQATESYQLAINCIISED